MSDDKQAKRCVRFFKIGRQLGNVDGLRKRLFHQKLHSTTIVWNIRRKLDKNSAMIEEIYNIKREMIQESADVDKMQEKLIDIYETLLVESLDMADQLLEEEAK